MNEGELCEVGEWFSGYVRRYLTGSPDDDANILLKDEHTHRVRVNAAAIARDLRLAEADLRLAEGVALLHDVGRFEQYRRFRTFRDADSVNHGSLGAHVLAEEGILGLFAEDERPVVARAVALHNAFTLPKDLEPRSLLHLKIVRDADKLDIWKVFLDQLSSPPEERASAVSLGFPDDPHISPAVVGSLAAGRMVNLAEVRTLSDFKLLQLSWVYDLNFKESLQMFRKRDYLQWYREMLPRTPEVAGLFSHLECYLAGATGKE